MAFVQELYQDRRQSDDESVDLKTRRLVLELGIYREEPAGILRRRVQFYKFEVQRSAIDDQWSTQRLIVFLSQTYRAALSGPHPKPSP